MPTICSAICTAMRVGQDGRHFHQLFHHLRHRSVEDLHVTVCR